MSSSPKIIFVTGGVVSSLGKGIAGASLAAVLEARGLKVTIMKLDPYINVDPGSKVRELYGQDDIVERHRHRYEVNNNLIKQITDKGLKIAGLSTDNKLVEIIENPNHPWFIGVQFHPEFTSNPRKGHPLFSGFIKAAKEYQDKHSR